MPFSTSGIALLGAYYVVLTVLAVFAMHRLVLILLLRRRQAGVEPVVEPDSWPSVLVQLPIYNEPNVAVRLIDAVANLQYPGPLSIQVLDDSIDETTALVAEAVLHVRRSGCDIEHVRRRDRNGYKAGALAEGLARSDAELVAIFDADFVPPPDLLRRVVPHFRDCQVGMVQARWSHLNRADSLLTRAQAVYLDAHFAVESAARFAGGRFFNFNGTAGMWRRTTIDDAGGWSSATLTEDLDLSYRAQLAGWKFVFLGDVEVPAELPSNLMGFHSQQKRWAKGSIQTARRILPRLWDRPLSTAIRVESIFHLTNNFAYLLTLILATLIVPAMAVRHAAGVHWLLAIDALLFALSTGSVVAFYREGQLRVGRKLGWGELFAVLPIGIGMSGVNAAAVLEGAFETGGHFSRTPKSGGAGVRLTLDRFSHPPIVEAILTVFFATSVIEFAKAGHYLAIPFLMLFLSGFGHVIVRRIAETIHDRSSVHETSVSGEALQNLPASHAINALDSQHPDDLVGMASSPSLKHEAPRHLQPDSAIPEECVVAITQTQVRG